MAIVQISKIQQRSGNLVDLPQLSEAEFGFASDEKRLFIGKTSDGIENIEVLTSYSNIDLNQINGSYGNLAVTINANTAAGANGQVMTFDGNNWVNRGGDAGGLITLGNPSNIKITGGAIDYVLTTDGTGNLNWTPKSTILSFIQNASNANPCVVTTTEDNIFVEGAEVTITNAVGMTELNGSSYFIDVISANTFALYTDPTLTTPVDATGYTPYAYTSVTATTASTNYVTVGDTSSFTQFDQVKFIGTTFGNITANQTYYIANIVSSTELILSSSNDGNLSNVITLATATGSANVYALGGRVLSTISGAGAGSSNAGGTQYSVQYNNSNLLDGDANFTYDFANRLLTISDGNVNLGNVNANYIITASRFISNVSTGTQPITVSSTTRVPNLNVAYANVSDFSVVTQQTTGTFYPVFVNGSTSSNYALGVNNSISFNALTGNFSTQNLIVNSNSNVGNISASGNINAANIYANSGTIGASLLTGTLTTAAQPNVTSIGNTTNVTVAGNLNPSANVTYDLGNTNNRWNDLYLSGSTVYLGNATITSNVSGVVITNANGGTFTISGTGTANSAAITNGTSNVIVQANSNVCISSTGNANVLVVSGAGANITGTFNATGNSNTGNLGTTQLLASANVTAPQFISNVSTGTAPLVVSSTTKVANLNADTLDGYDTATTATASTVVVRDNNGNITGNNITGTLVTASQNNITSVGNLSSLTVTANTTTGGIKTDNYYYANGVSISFAGSYSNSNVASYLPTYTGTVGTGAATFYGTGLTTGSNSTAGTITGNWVLSSGSKLEATYADLAEYYTADANYEPGTVLEFGGANEVTIASDATSKVAGLVSTNPAYVMNSSCEGKNVVALALQGRAPCKVRGAIKKGDMLISGGNGYARPSSQPAIGTVIGKALQNFDGVEGVIEVAVGRL